MQPLLCMGKPATGAKYRKTCNQCYEWANLQTLPNTGKHASQVLCAVNGQTCYQCQIRENMQPGCHAWASLRAKYGKTRIQFYAWTNLQYCYAWASLQSVLSAGKTCNWLWMGKKHEPMRNCKEWLYGLGFLPDWLTKQRFLFWLVETCCTNRPISIY